MRGHDDRQPVLARQRADPFQHHHLILEIERRGRLVEDQNARLSNSRSRSAALASAEGVASETAAFVQRQLKDVGDDEPYVQIDLSQASCEFILQGIVKRSSTPNHIAIVTSFTCTKMRPDGFGGMAVLVTADAIKGKSTQDLIGDFLDEAEHGSLAAAPGFGVHVLLRLHEQQVRQTIPHLIEADETLTSIVADAVTEDDIRAACIKIAERMELKEEGDSAVFKAALAAIREAERRLTPVR